MLKYVSSKSFKYLRCFSLFTSKMSPPKRWECYSDMGDVVQGTRFIALKVPLKKEIFHNLESSDTKFTRFTPEDAIKRIQDKGQSLGLMVDLTYTDQYYNTKEFSGKDIEHEKIYTEGHVVPNDGVIYRFFDVVERFIQKNSSENMVIGVHCTHGINRTGYIICRYMVERLGFTADNAIQAFNTARGHPMERENYIEHLYTVKHNPDYVIGNHPPVLKKEGQKKKKNNERYMPWRQRKKNKGQNSGHDMEHHRGYHSHSRQEGQGQDIEQNEYGHDGQQQNEYTPHSSRHSKHSQWESNHVPEPRNHRQSDREYRHHDRLYNSRQNFHSIEHDGDQPWGTRSHSDHTGQWHHNNDHYHGTNYYQNENGQDYQGYRSNQPLRTESGGHHSRQRSYGASNFQDRSIPSFKTPFYRQHSF